MGAKPPAAVDERISKDGRHDSDAAAPHSATLSPLQGRAEDSAFTPKLVELVFRPGSTRRAKKQSPRIACTAVAAPSCARESYCMFARLPPWRDVAAELHASVLSNAFPILPSVLPSYPKFRSASCPIDRKLISSFDIHPPSWVGQTQVLLSGGRGHCPRGLSRSPSVA